MQTGRVQLKTDAVVSEVLFQGSRAIGVRYIRHGALHTIYANKEVILSAGAANSPAWEVPICSGTMASPSSSIYPAWEQIFAITTRCAVLPCGSFAHTSPEKD